ncbi:MAG: hypothetical protein JXC31_05500 [Acholeplasmataceae bacterium]|nr:hypothetical protein [Acholeplasmataceae bacterium]
MTEIIMQAYEVLDELLKDPIYLQLKTYNQIINIKYKEEIEKFQLIKNQYDQVINEGGPHHPDFKKIAGLLSENKSNLYKKDEIKHYFELEKVFQNDINEFLEKLTHSVSSFIQVPNKIGIVSKGGSCHVR